MTGALITHTHTHTQYRVQHATSVTKITAASRVIITIILSALPILNTASNHLMKGYLWVREGKRIESRVHHCQNTFFFF